MLQDCTRRCLRKLLPDRAAENCRTGTIEQTFCLIIQVGETPIGVELEESIADVFHGFGKAPFELPGRILQPLPLIDIL